MGAKTPEPVKKANKPRPLVKCDVCGRKFLTVSAWKSHHKFLHAKTGPAKHVVIKKPENARSVKKKVVPVHLLKRVNPTDSKEVTKTQESSRDAVLAPKSSPVPKKPEFECPVCSIKYYVYFTAFRHIQKNHCIDENGAKVAPNSPNLVKPIRIETCASCDQKIRSTIPHDCPKLKMYKDQYLCTGCDQVFCGLVLFQHHVKGLHAKDVENYFFPSRAEFEAWKSELQEVINIEFTRLNKNKAKEIYHCSYQPSATTTATRLCPASITVREYSRGIHVCYFKEHCGHNVKDDELLKKFKRYSISLCTKDSEDLKLEAEDDNDLYLQFKNMMMCITKDAAKVDVATLRDLLDRALEMTTLLKSSNGEGHSTPLVSKKLSDDQISKSLDSLQPRSSKRKQSIDKEPKTVVAKKIKKTPLSVENGVSTRLSRSSTTVNKSVSFNKTVSSVVDPLDEELKQILEGDTGETQLNPVIVRTESLKGVLKKAEEPPLVEIEVKKPEPEPPVRSLIQSPSSFNDSYKNFVDQNFKILTESSTPKTKANVKKKEVMKTKIGQFKVKPASPKTVSPKTVSPKTVSPKTVSPKTAPPKTASPKSPKIVKEVAKEEIKEVPVTSIVFKPKLDIKYIVKEQENDCNILILKI